MRSRGRTSALLVAAAVATAGLLPPSPATAAYVNIDSGYASGPSGTVSAITQRDAYTYRSRAAADPNPNYGINVASIFLVRYTGSSRNNGTDTVVAQGLGNYTSTYRVWYTGTYRSTCGGWYTYMEYGTTAGAFNLFSSGTPYGCYV